MPNDNPEPKIDDKKVEKPDDEKVEDPAKLLEMTRKKDAENLKLKNQLKEHESELERLRKFEEDAQSEHEKALSKARKEGADEARQEMSADLLKERVRARASGKLTDPEDAIRLVDLDALKYDDIESIDAAVESLVESKPYLATDAEKPKPKPGDIDQGNRGGPASEGDEETAEDWLRAAIGAKQGVPAETP